MHKYADDTYLLVPSNNSHLIQDELDHIETWSTANNLRLNRGKSTEIVVHSRRINVCLPPPVLVSTESTVYTYLHLFSPLVLKYQIDLPTILLLFYGTISHLIYVRLFITSPLLQFQNRLCLIFQTLFSLRC